MRTTAYGCRVCPACRGAAGLYDTPCETCGSTGLHPDDWTPPMIPEPEPTAGHDSAHRPPGFSYVIAALDALAYGLIQIGLLITGIILISAALVAVGAKKLVTSLIGDRA